MMRLEILAPYHFFTITTGTAPKQDAIAVEPPLDMTNQLRALLAASDRLDIDAGGLARPRRRFSVELDRRGLFLRLGGTEAYLCREPSGAWFIQREPGGFAAQ
jgi:hypothetical protein